jgi:hypothetical protein
VRPLGGTAGDLICSEVSQLLLRQFAVGSDGAAAGVGGVGGLGGYRRERRAA